MKKALSILLSLVVVGTLFVGCGNSSKKGEDKKAVNTLEKVKEAKKIKIGLEDTYPPMEFRDNKNELVGFDIDLSKEIAKKLGVETEFVITEFGGLTMALNSGKFDMSASAISITDKRSKEVDFTKPYAKGGQVVIVKKGNTSIKTEADLKGKVAGCQLGTTGEEAAKKIQGLKDLKTYDKATQPFQDLEIGRIDAVVVDEFVGRYYLAKQQNKFDIAVTLNQEPIGIAFKKGDKELKDEVQKAIDELTEDGTMSKLSIKWFGTDIYKK
ncbi:polar amino acid transport system substrate-binding protein [Clostridium tetanomorphum]|uniref:Amino acid ABC transporter substrate-binding protein n=1 Tax=Clostridium tetanomorphum TaxID=1553 RepID=A0A923E9Z2_CLOTT|nr:ABC transporter substrate-binding protein [Clostridium tetanomorphum]KAJ50296.1 cystine/glutamine-binding periplasmic protein [Clostridium tetanomorphum DSM 665]MBC2397957.1 amino acid ABC transporter substrate-binding protein [Clostridium tetanomorphum]MBP1864537.1 polar amino acid transport system substrate-binding protein [Clostridium tetanomorphum]NRS82931.1 polar amino acid transport system substrate-binding protein [Clostridium tetanomorphum]NRZ98972.1 polar amino acid transport syste